MATPVDKKDRLAPPLMYAFRAAHRERDAAVPRRHPRPRASAFIASRRAASRAPISESELRKLVNSDLVALLNTTNLEAAEDLSRLPRFASSILNFGFPDLTHRSIDEGWR